MMFEDAVDRLTARANVSDRQDAVLKRPPLLAGRDIPDFWARVDGGTLMLFVAHPYTRGLRYPMRYGQSDCDSVITRDLKLTWAGVTQPLRLRFSPNQSLLLRVDGAGRIRYENISYEPPSRR